MGQSLSTKERLTQAGKKVIYRKGYHSTRISDITSEAGLAHGTFYLYFKSKEEFLLEMLSTIRKEVLSLIERGISLLKGGKTEEGKELVFLRSFELIVKEKELAKIFFFEAICTSNSFQEFYKEGKRLFMGRLEESLRLLGIENPDLKAEIVIGTARHLVEEAILSKREVIDRWREVLRELGLFS